VGGKTKQKEETKRETSVYDIGEGSEPEEHRTSGVTSRDRKKGASREKQKKRRGMQARKKKKGEKNAI